MSKKDDGGPVYPQAVNEGTLEFPKTVQYLGKSLRDELAESALIGILSCFRDHSEATNIPDRARLAYKYADAMLAERAKE